MYLLKCKCMNLLRKVVKKENGGITVEMVIVMAALVAVAILFKDAISTFVSTKLAEIFKGV